MKVSELPYQRDTASLFAKIADEPWSMFLDSAYPEIDLGRYDIFVARPMLTIETNDKETCVIDKVNDKETRYSRDPFLIVKEYLGNQEQNFSGLPFCGGAVGYFSYDLGRKIEVLPELAMQDVFLPEMAIGIYDWAVIVDHHLRQSWLASHCRFPETTENWNDLVELFSSVDSMEETSFEITSDVESNMSKEQYQQAFKKIKDYVLEGDCYQVNLAQRFSAGFQGNSWSAYLKLRQFNPAPYAAYINIPSGAVLSSSPERFLLLNGKQVETKPIKGTKPRSNFAYEDKALAVSLLESEKDRAENLMIVDLLRNDIGKACQSGTVAVPKLFALESYASVHHMVSTVTGNLSKNKHAIDLLRDCFPGGSITGAPKHRSMEIIEELEPHRRSVYCGSIAYVGFDGNMDSNIAIRTMVQYENKLYFHAGGGIVWDSDVESEYKECFHKAAAMMKLFQHEDVL